MASTRSVSQRTADGPAAATLIEVVRLLARQAARELAEQPPEGNQPTKPTFSEDRS